MSELWEAPVEGEVDVVFSDGTRRKLQVGRRDDQAIYQGDIVLGTIDEVLRPNADLVRMGIGITGSQFRWPGGEIGYEVDPHLPDPQRVTDAIQHWEDNTDIRFVERTPTNRHRIADFLSFEDRGGCWAYVGRRTGRQIVSLGAACPFGSVVHEIGHSVGLWHEQSRGDRDRWITIMWDRIDPTYRHNFDQHTEDGRDLGEYDFGSIMHYPPVAFSTTGEPSIVTKVDGVSIGQRARLSEGDVAAVAELYR